MTRISDFVGNVRLTQLLSQQEIMELQCGLLVSSFRDQKTITRVKENIGRISDGSSSHCAGALKLGLKKAFELKKKRHPPRTEQRSRTVRLGATGNWGWPIEEGVLGSHLTSEPSALSKWNFLENM